MDRDPGRLWADLDALLADARTAGCHDAVANTLISMGTVLHHRGERTGEQAGATRGLEPEHLPVPTLGPAQVGDAERNLAETHGG